MTINKNSEIIFGGDYFPEQWPQETWKEDIRLMKQANVNMVSIGIFSWALLQPDENTFTFDWLDKIMDMLAANNIDVCLGTATAAQPNWLTRKYDDILFVRETGEQVPYGSRQTYCVNSPSYRKAIRRLVEKMAIHYKGHKALALWHINNEYANKNSMCFCKNCEKAFRGWLQKKYGTIDNLNESWGTVFWSEKYSDWEEINTPRASAGGRNATKLLDYKRFLSESFFTLYMEEYNVIHPITPEVPITSNFEGDWSKFDHFLFRNHLDVVSFNIYPDPGNPDARKWAALRHTMMRSLLGKPFMVMEQAPSQVDWYPVNIPKPPGLMRLWSYQALAHGSDSVMYFQWRASKKGAEKYHSGMVPHFGENSRVFKEISALGNELKKVKTIVGSNVDSKVAILLDNDSWWAVDNPYGHGTKSLDNEVFWSANGQPFPTVLVSYFGELEYYFNAFYDLNIPVDVIPVDYDFSKYKIIVAPLLHMVKPGFKEAVENFVKKGGTFITTYFTGVIDESVGVFLGGYLGPLKDVLGVKVEEYNPLPPGGKNAIKMTGIIKGFKKKYGCSIWCDVAHTTSAKTLATFVDGYYAGSPSFTENQFGDGKAYYVATRPDKDFMRDFLSKIAGNQGIKASRLPEGVELVTRCGGGQDYSFYLNHNETKKQVTLPKGKYEDLLAGTVHQGTLALAKYGVSILRKTK
ncbi:MAG: beta-galactosidase [Sedimentisphaerales bacterium]|jgi:beta-galactosidase